MVDGQRRKEMALTANREVDRYVDQELRTLPVKAGTQVFKGALVGLNGGFARGLTAGDAFAGIAYAEADNSAGGDGDQAVRVFTLGDFEHALASASRANNGAEVFASDDETLTLTASGNSLVGRQVDVSSTGTIVLRLRSWMGT
jgi:pectate lyase